MTSNGRRGFRCCRPAAATAAAAVVLRLCVVLFSRTSGKRRSRTDINQLLHHTFYHYADGNVLREAGEMNLY